MCLSDNRHDLHFYLFKPIKQLFDFSVGFRIEPFVTNPWLVKIIDTDGFICFVMMETQDTLHVQAGRTKSLKTQSRPSTCFTSFRLWHHNVLKKSVRSRPLSAARCYFNTGYWRWPPRRLERGPTPDGALVWEQKGGGEKCQREVEWWRQPQDK